MDSAVLRNKFLGKGCIMAEDGKLVSKTERLSVRSQNVGVEFDNILRESSSNTFSLPKESVTRLCVLNFIVCSEDALQASASEDIVAKVFGNIPLRAVFVNLSSEASTLPKTDVSSFCRVGEGGAKQICVEQVFLNANAEVLQELPGTIFPTLVPDLPVFLWWRGDPPLREEYFHEILEACNVVILDSVDFHNGREDMLLFKSLVDRRFSHCVFTDMNWFRLGPWREEIARFFDVPKHLENINNIKEVTIKLASDARNSHQALLFLGWLAALLTWECVKSQETMSGVRFFMKNLRTNADVEVEIVGVEMNGAMLHGVQESILSVRFEIEGIQKHTFILEAYKKDEDVCTSYVDVGVSDESDILLSQLQTLYHDSVFINALKSSCDILSV